MSPLDPAASLMGRDWGIGSRSFPTRTIGAGVPRLATCRTCTPSFAVALTTAATVADRTTTAPTMKDREAVPANAEEARRSERAAARGAARVIMPLCFSNRRTTQESPNFADLHCASPSKKPYHQRPRRTLCRLDVHQPPLRVGGANALSRRLRVGGGVHDISVLFQKPTQKLHVHLVVVHDENALSRQSDLRFTTMPAAAARRRPTPATGQWHRRFPSSPLPVRSHAGAPGRVW